VSGGRVDIGADEASCGDGLVDPGETCDDGDLIDCNGCDSNCTASSVCGNGVRCGAEQCDDGNTGNGDCCSSLCQFEALDSACDDQDLCTITDRCDGAGGCAGTAAPAPVCRQPTLPGKSSLLIRDKIPDDSDLLSWRWTKGAQTDLGDLGDPLTSTTYTLCLYDQSANPQPRFRAVIAAGGWCDGQPCWTQTSAGFRRRDRDGPVRSIKLKPGASGKAQVTLRGKGTDLDPPPLGLAPTVTVQLKNSAGECWGASYTAPAKNESSQFTAKSD
jgi:cysteine-rich repeat protein